MRLEGRPSLRIEDFYKGQFIYFYEPEIHVRDGKPEPTELAVVLNVDKTKKLLRIKMVNGGKVFDSVQPQEVYATDSELKYGGVSTERISKYDTATSSTTL